MQSDFKTFMFGLDQCRQSGGMIWYGKIPKEVIDLYELKVASTAHGYNIAGVYVQIKPQYEAFEPDWNK